MVPVAAAAAAPGPDQHRPDQGHAHSAQQVVPNTGSRRSAIVAVKVHPREASDLVEGRSYLAAALILTITALVMSMEGLWKYTALRSMTMCSPLALARVVTVDMNRERRGCSSL